MRRFLDRTDAGRVLGRHLVQFRDRNDVLVLALPRGGVPVGFEVAQALGAPLDIFLVRKLGFPGHEEFALGAIASGGVRILNPAAMESAALSESEINDITATEQQELERRERSYRDGRPLREVSGKISILVDDGLATGSTMRAAVAALRQLQPARIIVAVPVAPRDAIEQLRHEADDIFCPNVPARFRAVGQWYDDFAQTTDEEVQQLLRQATVTPEAI